ncbi:sterol desaturase family protein [Nocardioides panacisoli]|uniref:sterol desaturase family protein n=1 Tax=Nocardioides panacisoli TaxID=627624 RepID=UPI001C629865|nr:sterol desaturase family protein [Nocardioides panacisoli]QYJ03218.1 sterol desaturase family protein [Nocardioides panacisoli]
MTKPTPEVEALAAERLARDEARMTGNRRRSLSLGGAWRQFWSHPSPFLITGTLVVAGTLRLVVGGRDWWEALVPVALVATFPFTEWLIHVAILHWRPRQVGPMRLDPLVARKHREHHADPRDLPLVFIPWQVLCWLLPGLVLVTWLALPTTASMLTTLVSIAAIGFGYEWTHYLIHSDYRPRSRWYRAVWRNHRLHHYKNEHYWFSVTTSGTSDRVLGTYPDPADVPTSPTVKDLHAAEARG